MACGRPARSTVTNGSATPRRAARSRCERRSTSAGGSRGPSERAMSGRVTPSADRHLRRRARPERHAPTPDRRQPREMLRRPPWSSPCTSGAMRSVSGRGSMAYGPFGDRGESDAEIVFVQYGTEGTGRVKLADTVAAIGVPDIVRYFGTFGMPVNYRISRGEVLARYEDGPAVTLRFTRVGDRIYGRVAESPSFQLILDRQ